MKLPQLIALACCMNHAVGREVQPVTTMRDVVSHEQLAQQLLKTQQQDPMKSMETSTGEDPALKNRPVDLISQSDVICFGGMATLVPKRAILSTPPNLKDRLAAVANVRIVSWSEFYVANRAWITTEEVSFPQAAGKLALSDAATKRIGKSTNLVVATYLGGPISVLPANNSTAAN